jgi:hypothetical protein
MKKSDLERIVRDYDEGKGWTRGLLRNDSAPIQKLREILKREDIEALDKDDALSPAILAELKAIYNADYDRNRPSTSLTAVLMTSLDTQLTIAAARVPAERPSTATNGSAAHSNPTQYRADVGDDQARLKAQKTILHKPEAGHTAKTVTDYVINVYTHLDDNFVATRDQSQIKVIAFPSEEVKQFHQLKPSHFYASLTVPLRTGWHPLPCLSPHDVLLAMNCSKHKKENLQLGYCEATNQYLIRYRSIDPLQYVLAVTLTYNMRTTAPSQEQISYATTQSEQNEHFNNLSRGKIDSLARVNRSFAIDFLTRFCLSFESDSPLAIKHNASEKEKWAARLQQCVGVCRHRAILFMSLAQKLGINVRLVTNDVHAFVQVKNEQGGWVNVDLGGASRDFEVEQDYNIHLQELPQRNRYRNLNVTFNYDLPQQTDFPFAPGSSATNFGFASLPGTFFQDIPLQHGEPIISPDPGAALNQILSPTHTGSK